MDAFCIGEPGWVNACVTPRSLHHAELVANELGTVDVAADASHRHFLPAVGTVTLWMDAPSLRHTLLASMPVRFALATALLVLTTGTQAQSPSPLHLAASSLGNASIVLDGHLDEAVWATAQPATGFVQNRPTPGAAASQTTEARVLYDGGAVYVGMRMTDTDAAAIRAPLGRRDADLSTDLAYVGFDSYHDRRTAYLFGVNPAGVKLDKLFFDDGNGQDDSWDAVWDVATSRDSLGWTAEFRIPLGQLRYTPSAETWGVEFGRVIQRTGEEAMWAPVLPTDNGFVSRFGELAGLVELGSPRRLEVVPYVSAQATRAPDTRATGGPADPYYAPTDLAPRAGVDLKLGLTSSLTLTATVNPDFGQVEADPAQVNLGGFELFLEERRPFFVEGSDVFSFGRARRNLSSNRPQLLYTRRIGRSPQRQGFVPGDVTDAIGSDETGEQGVVYTDAPQQTTILGAAKVSGRIGRMTLGVLSAVTAPEYGRYTAFDGTGNPVTDGRGLVEPLTSYSVARARAMFGQTIVGAAGTLVVRDLSDPAFPSLMPSQASVLELDAEHTLAGGQWITSGVLAGSLVTGSTDAIVGLQRAFPRLYQRPDAGHLGVDSTRTSLSGLTGEIALQKAGGEHWLGSVSAAFTSPGFDSNSLGFQSRADDAYIGGVLIYSQNTPRAWYRSWSADAYASVGGNFDGDMTRAFVGLEGNVGWANFWRTYVSLNLNARSVDDRETRGGVLALDPASLGLNLNASTDSRRAVSGYVSLNGGTNEIGQRYVGGEIGADIRPASNLTVGLYPGISVDHEARQFVTALPDPAATGTFGRRAVFAASDQAEFSVTARVDWTFSPALSLQLYARPFVSRGRYDTVQEPTAPRQLRFPAVEDAGGSVVRGDDGTFMVTPGDGGQPYTLQPDFTVRALQGNAVLRWEYRPGSTLFFVWQQQRNGFEPDGRSRFDRNLGRLATDPLQNVFLLKLSYWIG